MIPPLRVSRLGYRRSQNIGNVNRVGTVFRPEVPTTFRTTHSFVQLKINSLKMI